MARESVIEFHQRWIQTAEADMQTARRIVNRDRLICSALMIPFFGGEFIHLVDPGIGWAKIVFYLFAIPLLMSLLNAARSISNLGDAKKFLARCRRDLAIHGHPMA